MSVFKSELLHQVADIIRYNPKQYDQTIWFDLSESGKDENGAWIDFESDETFDLTQPDMNVCGTKACIGGHIVGLVGWRFFIPQHSAIYRLVNGTTGLTRSAHDVGVIAADAIIDEKAIGDEGDVAVLSDTVRYVMFGHMWMLGRTSDQVANALDEIAEATTVDEAVDLIRSYN